MREKNVLRKKVFLRKIKRCKNLFVFESEKQCCFPKSSPFVGENQVVKKVLFFYKWKNVFFKFLFDNQVAPGAPASAKREVGRRDLVFNKRLTFENKLFGFVFTKKQTCEDFPKQIFLFSTKHFFETWVFKTKRLDFGKKRGFHFQK